MADRKPAAKATAPLGATSPEAIASGNPAAQLFAAAAGQAGAMPATPAVGATKFSSQVVKSQPVRVEIRIGGRTRYANLVYDPTIDVEDGKLVFMADTEPTWIDPPKFNPPTRFVEREDARNGDEVLQRVHTGRRDIIEPESGDDETSEGDEGTDESKEGDE